MQVIIIADTSCLVLLSKLDRLDLLKKLYGTVHITSTIYSEYGQPLPHWINIKDPQNNSLPILELSIDRGEASAVALALENKEHLLILDDLKARKFAARLELIYTGTLGILLEAKRRGLLNSISSVIEQIKQTNFHLPPELELQLLVLAGENN